MTKTIISAILVTSILLAGCQSPSPETKLTPVATTTVTDTDGVIPRFTNDIWPAIVVYNAYPGQGSPGDRQFIKIKLRGMDSDASLRLESAAHELGVVQQGDQTQGDIRRDGNGLRLADTSLTSVDSAKATLEVCYTFTANTYPDNDINHPVGVPTASEATFELHKTDNWYLYSITNNHVVQGCSTSPKV